MIDKRSSWVRFLFKTRRLIKTVMRQLVERFNLARVKARDLWLLTSRINIKLLAQSPMAIRHCQRQCRCAESARCFVAESPL